MPIEAGTLTIHDASGAVALHATGEALLSNGRVLTTLDSAALTWDTSTSTEGEVVRLRFRNLENTRVAVEQIRPLVAVQGYRRLQLEKIRIQQTGWQSWSRSHPPAPFAPNAETAAPPIRGPRLPHRRADSQVETWMTVLEPTDGRSSVLLGFLSARDQLGTIEVIPSDSGGHTMVAAVELDGVALAPGAELASEPLLVAMGSTSDLLDLYARRVAEAMDARHARETVSGWCSWYQLYTTVSEADVDRNVETLVRHRDQLPLWLVQLDDGYQHEVGDWLELNDKFPNGMRPLVERIRDQGYVPGLWLAPFLVSGRSHTYADHPHWVVRDERGESLNAINNWGAPNYALDTTHPEALAWLEHVLHTVADDWGYDYVKLDFLYAAAMRGQRYDASVTGVQAYRRGLEALRRAAGERFILGCGAPLLPSIGLVDGMRIGADVASAWGEEGNADGPSMVNALRATLARMWMHRSWWSNDPDCVLVRASDSKLNLTEVQAWAAVVALSGGMLLAGDDLSRAEPERLALLSRLLPSSGVAARAHPPLHRLMPERLHLRLHRAWATWDVVGLANWSDTARPVAFDPTEFGLTLGDFHVVDLWTGEYLGRHSSSLDLGVSPPHSLRLLAVHADLGRPQTIGSTGHLLGDAMDVTSEMWDATKRTLTLVPSQIGPRSRRADFLVYDPDGVVRRVPFTTADARPITIEFA